MNSMGDVEACFGWFIKGFGDWAGGCGQDLASFMGLAYDY
jgi:hypothetical protein